MKSILIVILSIVSVGAFVYGYIKNQEAQELVSKAEATAKEAELKANEFQKMYSQALSEIQIQRTLCEEQLKSLKQSN